MSAGRRFDVAFPLIGFNPSGGVRMIVRVANALAERAVSIAFSVPESTASPPLPLHPDVTVLARRGGGGLAARLGVAGALPDARVCVASGYQTPLLIAAGALAHGRRTHLVYLIQNDEPVSHIRYGTQPAWSKPALVAIAHAGYRIPATRIAVSRFVAERVGRHRVHRVIPPGIDPVFLDRANSTRRRDHPDDGLTVGTLSHPAPVKGLEIALDALARLCADGSVRAVVYDGAHAAPIPSFAQPFSMLAASEGRPRDIVEFYSRCDVFVFPSLVEGFGLPPLEAMACGAAVVVANCGGVREYVEPDVNCVLVPPGDADAIVAAVRRLASQPDLRARIVEGGRETARRFPVGAFAEACADEIVRVLAGPSLTNPH